MANGGGRSYGLAYDMKTGEVYIYPATADWEPGKGYKVPLEVIAEGHKDLNQVSRIVANVLRPGCRGYTIVDLIYKLEHPLPDVFKALRSMLLDFAFAMIPVGIDRGVTKKRVTSVW